MRSGAWCSSYTSSSLVFVLRLQVGALFLATSLFHHCTLKKKTVTNDSFPFRFTEKRLRNLARMAQALSLRLLLAFLAIGSCGAAEHIDLWPMPKLVTHGTQKLGLNIVVHSTEDEVICWLDLMNCKFLYKLQCLFLLMLCAVHLLQLNFGIDESYNLTVLLIAATLFFFKMTVCQSEFPILLLCRYAEKRGVNILAEIDVPGHALSW